MNINLAAKPLDKKLETIHQPAMKVVGLGGGGCNAINRMIELGLNGVDYIAVNTDGQALKSSLASTKIQLGPQLTRGLGAGGNPSIGEAAAEESFRELSAALVGADMVFLAAGMGGGTGTGSIPVVARVARSLGAVTVAVVTMPFSFEVGRRQKNAREGLARLRPFTDTLITVPNDRLLQIAPRDLPLELAFRMADDVLRQGIQGISELITQPGLINVDFSHIRQMMISGGGSLLSIGHGQGNNKALQAIDRALHHPLIESINLEDATGIIANITGGQDLTFQEVMEALTFLQDKTNNRAEIVPGVITDERMEGRVEVILIITGLGATPVDTASVMQKTGAGLPITQPVEQPLVRQPVATAIPVRAPAPATPANMPRPSMGASFQPAAAPVHPAQEPQPFPSMRLELASSAANNLDLPAFMRRRIR